LQQVYSNHLFYTFFIFETPVEDEAEEEEPKHDVTAEICHGLYKRYRRLESAAIGSVNPMTAAGVCRLSVYVLKQEGI